ncbi:hypothetical protein C1646_753087 [Rhizophagus diaphanus]|nr:hypothetical protein C1646_753087 [Rhizophagus diaphanus] [Rhizophagus sp. MUCL 43196]
MTVVDFDGVAYHLSTPESKCYKENMAHTVSLKKIWCYLEFNLIFDKMFFKEFVDTHRHSAIQKAPQVLYSSKEPPLEVRHLQNKLK